MIARARSLGAAFGGMFWLLPGVLVTAGVVGAVALVEVDRSGAVPKALLDSPWLYNGGSTGARTLLGVVASSTIGVAGTVFSITIAALSLAAGQMGPRLLRNFTRDRGNQLTLGVFLGTFSFALMVLRTVRDRNEGEFIPHLALSVALALALVCVGVLVYFVDHMASRINVDTVVGLVSDDVRSAFTRLTSDEPQTLPPPADHWDAAVPLFDKRRGYLQQLDADALVDWAARNQTSLCMAVRLGDFVFPGAPIALILPPVSGAEAAICDATVLAAERATPDDLEFAVRQLVELAVRALSPGINDPMTAISVLDQLGAALCDLSPRHLSGGVHEHNGRPLLVVPRIDYDGLVDTMFHMIRQNAASCPAVLIRLVEVLTSVLRCESDRRRMDALERHVDLVLSTGALDPLVDKDRQAIVARADVFAAVRRGGAAALIAHRRS